MFVRSFAFGSALLFGIMLSESAPAQTPAALLYNSLGGSIAPAESSPLLAGNAGLVSAGLASAETYRPIYVAQNTSPATISPFTATPSPTPAVAAPSITSPGLSAAPTATLPPFDPYAVSPQTHSLSSILPIGNTGQNSLGQSSPSSIYTGSFDRFMPETYAAMRRFRDATSVEFTHLPSSGGNDAFGLDELEMRMQLAIPCRYIPDNGKSGFFYVAPALSLAWWNGPVGKPDMSPSGFGGFIDVGAQPQFNDQFGLIAWGRAGVFSDFKHLSSKAFRFQGRLEGVVTASPEMKVHAGVIYYGRSRVKMLPTGGVVWTPDDDWILRLTFPNPKVSRHLWTGQRADWWGYVHMDYMGGSWDIDELGLTDYNDIRIGMGIEFMSQGQVGGYFEFGGSFARELYTDGTRWAKPPTVLFLKTGIIF